MHMTFLWNVYYRSPADIEVFNAPPPPVCARNPPGCDWPSGLWFHIGREMASCLREEREEVEGLLRGREWGGCDVRGVCPIRRQEDKAASLRSALWKALLASHSQTAYLLPLSENHFALVKKTHIWDIFNYFLHFHNQHFRHLLNSSSRLVSIKSELFISTADIPNSWASSFQFQISRMKPGKCYVTGPKLVVLTLKKKPLARRVPHCTKYDGNYEYNDCNIPHFEQ